MSADHENDYRRWPSSAEVFLPGGSPAVEIAAHMNTIVAWSFVLQGGAFMFIGVVRATGAVIGPLLILLGVLWGIRIPVAYGLSPIWGEDVIWWSIPLTWIVALPLAWAYYQYGGWRRRQIVPPRIPAPTLAPVAES